MSLDTPIPMPLSSDHTADDESLWIRKAQRGDQAAFTLLYRRHAQAIHSLAWRLTSDRQLAEDIAQETFMRLLRRFGGADPDRPLRPWLRQVASNLAIDRLRRSTLVLSDDILASAPALESEPDAYGGALGLLRHLSPMARALVWLNQVEGRTHLELGTQFKRSESWSKSIVSRALLHLRELASDKRSPSHESR